MKKTLMTIGIVAMLLLAALPLTVSAAGSYNVCRDLPEGDQAPGSAIAVSLDVTVDSATYYAIDEMVPAGWRVTSASNGGDFTSDPGHVKWVITGGAADTSYTYTVQIPATANGAYSFDGEFQMEGMEDPAEIGCETELNVAEDSNGETGDCGNVCRDLPDGDQKPGSAITVSLDVNVDSATYYAIDEIVPAGWTVTSASNGGDFTSDSGHVKWVLTGGAQDTTYTYTVRIPAAASGAYSFAGEFQMEGMEDPAEIGCDKQINVAEDSNGGTGDCSNVCRNLPDGDQKPGSAITVSLDVKVDSATYYAIDEMVPAGWKVSSANNGGDFTSDPGHVKWVLTGGAQDTTYTYTVKIPENAIGTYTFSGIFQMEGMEATEAIGCDTQVNVPDGLFLVSGWNFISVPYTLDDPSFEKIIYGLPIDCVMRYNAAASSPAEEWEHSQTLEWEALRGYWVHAEESCCIPAERLIREQENNVLPEITLYPGWNAVGSSATCVMTADCVFDDRMVQYTKIVGPWALSGNGSWNYLCYGLNNEDSGTCYDEEDKNYVTTDLFEVYPYEGYWIYVTDTCELA